jgi:hypothetical protein
VAARSRAELELEFAQDEIKALRNRPAPHAPAPEEEPPAKPSSPDS